MRSLSSLWRPCAALWLAVGLALGLALPATAQHSGADIDRGEYQILQALYGTERTHVDVTTRVREQARLDASFPVGAASLGSDPGPVIGKMLRIVARGADGRVRAFDFAEGQVVDGAQFGGWAGGDAYRGGWQGVAANGALPGAAGAAAAAGQYRILQALYGTERAHVDVTPRLRELAAAGGSFRLGNATFGTDPAPGQVKTLRVLARGPDGQTRVFDYPENGVVDGAPFSGWSRGAFGDPGYRGTWQAGTGMGAATGAATLPGRDAGQYQILQALYGTDRAHVDVTTRLRELARSDRSIRLGNATFGTDPDPGQMKMLRIHARGPDGQTRIFDYPENGVVDGAQFSGWDSGAFGDGGYRGVWQQSPQGVEPARGAGNPGARDAGEYRIVQALYGTARRHVDVTETLRTLAQSDQVLRVSRAAFNVDPDPGRTKALRIFARGRGNQVQLFEFTEGSVVDGAQFRGWRGGQWASRDGARIGWNGASAGTAQAQGQPAWATSSLTVVGATYGSDAQRVDVTQQLRGRIAGGRLDAVVDNGLFGFDPAPGVPKALWVTYSLDGRTQQQVRVEERGRLMLP